MIKKYFKHGLILLFLTIGANLYLVAQENVTLNLCDKHIQMPFISDGQQYRALLNEDEVAEFRVTFYGGSMYRLVSCSGKKDGQLIFTLYDKERNVLFSSRDYQNSPYWDFKFKSTVDCIIETQLAPTAPSSGFAILQIGFEK
ncbi:MAG: hypothetical protein KAI79_16835 [Bacteroidales bacterium]|nr:hypothetical protein [Bacteroidales bacterium]